MTFSYYELYLRDFLNKNYPDKASDIVFINERSNQAAEVYEQSRLEGYTPEGAQELAMVALVDGLHFSKFNTIIEVILNEFEDKVEPGNASALALKLLPILENIFSNYSLSDDFAQSPEYDLLYTELTGAIVIYIEEHGV